MSRKKGILCFYLKQNITIFIIYLSSFSGTISSSITTADLLEKIEFEWLGPMSEQQWDELARHINGVAWKKFVNAPVLSNLRPISNKKEVNYHGRYDV